MHHVLLFLSESLLLLRTEILSELINFLEFDMLPFSNLAQFWVSLCVKIIDFQLEFIFDRQRELIHFKMLKKGALCININLFDIF